MIELICWCLLGGLIGLGNLGAVLEAVPLGRENDSTVTTFNAWTAGWNAASLGRGLVDYWQAPIFYPQPGTFAFSESQPTMLVVAPLAGIGDSHALAYNVYLMLLLGLNPWVTRRLLLSQGYSVRTSLCCALLMLLLPFVHQQLGVVQLVAICGPLGVIWRVICWVKVPNWLNSLWLGISYFLTYAACHYYGLFLSMLAPVFLVLLWRRLGSRSHWTMLSLSAMTAFLLVLPIVAGQLIWLHGEAEPRSLESIKGLSASPVDYLSPYWTRWKHYEFSLLWGTTGTFHLGHGSLLTSLSVVGGIVGLWNREQRRWTVFLLLLAGSAGVLSCGPKACWGTFTPYEWLRPWYPGLMLIRSPFRFAVIVQFAQVLLVAEVFRSIEHWLGQRGRLSATILVILAAAHLSQTWPPAPRLHVLPNVEQNLGWINWLRDHSSLDDGIVCLPFPVQRHTAGYEQTVDWMYLGLWHGRPMLNGYSGFFPDHYRQAKVFMKSFPDAVSVRLLRQWGIRYFVVNQHDAAQVERASENVRLQYSDPVSAVQVYAIILAE